MAITLIASESRGGTGETTAVDTTGADFLVAAVNMSNGIGISDSKSNTWTKLTEYTGAYESKLAIYYVKDPVVGTNHTVTIGNLYPAVCFAAFSGVDTTDPFDQQSGHNESTTKSTGSITPTADGSLIIAACGIIDGSKTVTAVDSSLTLQEVVPGVGGTVWGIALAYYEQPSAAAINPTFTSDDSAVGCAIASFLAAAGGDLTYSASGALSASGAYSRRLVMQRSYAGAI